MSRRAGRPRVIANFALSADGKVSTRNFTPTGFTSKADKRRLLEIRCLGDALLAGARTISTDRMSMGIPASDLQERRRAIGLPSEPLRVIVSNSGAFDPLWKVFQKAGSQIIAFSTQKMPRNLRADDRTTRRSLDFRFCESRSRGNAPHPPERLPGADARLRRRPKTVSSAPGDWGGRRTPPDVDAADIRRCRSANAHRNSRGISASNDSLPA